MDTFPFSLRKLRVLKLWYPFVCSILTFRPLRHNPKGERGRVMGFFHFWDQRAIQKFLHFIEGISEFLNPDCSYTIENDHPKTIREKILLKVVLLSFQSSFLQYFILKVSIWERILLNVMVEGRARDSKG